jgi:hypothetical protein
MKVTQLKKSFCKEIKLIEIAKIEILENSQFKKKVLIQY